MIIGFTPSELDKVISHLDLSLQMCKRARRQQSLGLNFETLAQKEDALINARLCPHQYYHFRLFDKYVCIFCHKRFNKVQYYIRYSGFELSKDFSDISNLEYDINDNLSYYSVGCFPSLEEAFPLYFKVLSYVLNLVLQPEFELEIF